MKDRGSALIEFALIAPIFLGILLAIMDFGLLFWTGAQARAGVREGARAAAVAGWGTDTSCTLTGVTPGDATLKLMCFTKSRIDLNPTTTRVKVLLSAGGDEVGERVVVCAQTPGGSVTGLYQSIIGTEPVKSRVTMRIEVKGTLTAAEETPLASDGWASCTL